MIKCKKSVNADNLSLISLPTNIALLSIPVQIPFLNFGDQYYNEKKNNCLFKVLMLMFSHFMVLMPFVIKAKTVDKL